MKLRNNHIYLALCLILACALSCNNYDLPERDNPDCVIGPQNFQAPPAFRVENDPVVEITWEGQRYFILQDNMGGDITGPNNGLCPGVGCNQINVYTSENFFQINVVRPYGLEGLENAVGETTPLLTLNEMETRDSDLVHFGMSMVDACGNSFSPIESQSNFNRIDSYEVVSSFDVDTDTDSWTVFETIVSGQLSATFNTNTGQNSQVNINYRLRVYLDAPK